MIVNKCCIDGMREMADESVDLIVTDPPYLMNYVSAWRKHSFGKIKGDKSDFQLISDFFTESARLLKDGGGIYSFCSWQSVDFFKQEFEKHFKLKNILVWNKNNHGSGDLAGSYAPKHEFILFGAKGRHLLNKRIADVVNCQRVDVNKMVHPTEKPVPLLEIFIQNSSKVGDIILDPFSGCGSTGIACANLQRDFIGFELDENYAKIGNKRIKEVLNKTQLRLF